MFLSNKQKEIVLGIWGKKRYDEAIRCIDLYAEKWQLEKFELIDKNARNLVLMCVSPKHGSCVLKIGFDGNFEKEIEVLRTFNGRGCCRLYEYSIEDKTHLIERILPGDDLEYGTTRDERGGFFCDLYKELYSIPVKSTNSSIFPTVLSLLDDNKKGSLWRKDCEFISPHIERARENILTANAAYNTTLLHGDLNCCNILKNKNGKYTAIDPIGLIGSPVFNIAEFIMGQWGNVLAAEPIEYLIDFIDLMSAQASVSAEILKKCLYVETVVGLYGLEYKEGQYRSIGGSLKGYDYMVDNVLTAEKIMGDL